MSTFAPTTHAAGRPGSGSAQHPGLGRLTAVELRKMTDTRSGFWLLVSVVLISLAVVVVTLLTGSSDAHALENVFANAVQPAAVLLPVVGILLVTAEWSQRTALITFTLVPHRGRILAAKILASLVLATATLGVCLALAALGTAVGGTDTVDAWSMSATMFGQTALLLISSMLTGVAFGAIMLASAPAIAVYFVLPLALVAVSAISALESAMRWIDQDQTLGPLAEHALSGTEWTRAGVGLLVWVVAPLLAGLWRFRRADIR
jgi:ABC-type transport system involved in multi-copper enzyme maturation permease subunit